MTHELPALPYARDALEPHLSAETLDYHHGKHHKAYVDKLNDAIKDTDHAALSLEEIIRHADGFVFNQAAQVWNHTFYWHCMSPDGGGQPDGALQQAIIDAFGTLDAFRDKFGAAVKSLFGSGWVWLVREDDDRLVIESTRDGDNPLAANRHAVLCCDAWEHAFYIDYRNDKGKYVDAFWQVVNWDFVAANHAGEAFKAA
ncbi:MAG: superoxide dismutase [Gammaproteobacteria bacterium]